MSRYFSNVWNSLRARLNRPYDTPHPAGANMHNASAEVPARVGLALGGGGGKGGAHLGVLAVLESLEVPIDVITGSSIGGAVGVLYAAGLSLTEIEEVFRETALSRIATTDPTRTGLIGSRKREAALVRLLGDRSFADLHIPCAVVTVDLVSGCEVIIDEGPLVPAILATTALPGIFPPVVRGAEILVDGSVRNNLPVDVAERMGAQRVIAVDLTDALPGFALSIEAPANPLARLTLAPRQFAIASRALSLLMAEASEARLAKHLPAIHLRPDVGHIDLLDTSRPEEGRRVGEVAAITATAELLALRAWRLAVPTAPTPPAPPRRHFTLPAVRWPGASLKTEG